MSPDRLMRVCQAVAETQGDSVVAERHFVGLQTDVARCGSDIRGTDSAGRETLLSVFGTAEFNACSS